MANAAEPSAANSVDCGSRATEAPGAITPATIAESEKIHALHFTAAQREELAGAVPTGNPARGLAGASFDGVIHIRSAD
jgi:hypothetical protein